MSEPDHILEVYQCGELTVVGFGGDTILDQINISSCRAEIEAVVKQCGAKTLAFDLTGVQLIPSGLLGLLSSLRKLGVEVHLYNPSGDVQDVLRVTKLDQLFPIHFITTRR